MRFFRNFHDLRGRSRGNRRSNLIFMGGGGEVPYILCARWMLAMLERHAISHHKLQVYTLCLHLQVYIIQAWDFSGIPEFSRPQRPFSWKSQIRFNIYGGGGGTIYCVCSLTVSNVGTARLISSLSTYFKYWVITSFKCMHYVYMYKYNLIIFWSFALFMCAHPC